MKTWLALGILGFAAYKFVEKAQVFGSAAAAPSQPVSDNSESKDMLDQSAFRRDVGTQLISSN